MMSKSLNKNLLLVSIFTLLLGPLLFAQEARTQNMVSAENEKRLNTLRYGTDTEIATLIQTLKTENDPSLDNALIELAETSPGS